MHSLTIFEIFITNHYLKYEIFLNSMSIIKYVIYLLLLVSGIFSVQLTTFASGSISGKTIVFCEDSDGFPPYIWDNSNQKNNIRAGATGFNVEFIEAILKKHRVKALFKFLPWKRCLKYVESNEIQVVLDLVNTEERANKYLMTNAFFKTTAYYFYDKKLNPKGLKINKPSDLPKAGLICGRLGSNYTKYGISNEEVWRTARSFEQMLMQLYIGRCNLFLGRFEVLLGYKVRGQDYFSDGRLGFAPIPTVKPSRFHMGISRKFKFANELKKIIDEGINTLKDSGETEKILKKYIPKNSQH